MQILGWHVNPHSIRKFMEVALEVCVKEMSALTVRYEFD